MKQSGALLFKSTAFLLFAILASLQVSGQQLTRKLDDFNRNDSLVVGNAAIGTNPWLETETAGSNNYRVRIKNAMLVLGSYNNATPVVGSSGLEQAAFDVSNQYGTVFNQASADLTWAFNFRQSRSGTSGFGATTYGIAFILGASKANFTDADAVGYAVIIGNSSSPDPVKLVRFKNGLTANSNITTLVSSSEIVDTAFYGVNVNFEPCSKTWSLKVRNTNGVFTDPVAINAASQTVVDQTYTSTQLNYVGAAYNHGTANVTAYFDNIYVPTATALTAINYTWNGASSNDFSVPTNWTPARTCVRAIDVLNFNSGANIVISNVSTQEIGQLLVSNNTSLSLKAATGATQTISLAGNTGTDLSVEAGSSLVIDSNDPLVISLKTGATGSVSGKVIFQNTAMNLGRAHRLLAADANAITFENGSQFVAKNLSGEPFGNSGTANIVIFKAGSTYFSKDGASPFGLATPNSKVIFETGSLYKHEQTGTAPKLDGRIYGDFELNVSGNLAIIFGTSAATPTRIDNFTISSGNMNVTLASGTTPLPLHIKGNLSVGSGAALNFNPAASANTSLLSFNGTSKQVISGNVNFGAFANLEINNAAGIELRSTLTINGNLLFTQGNISLYAPASLTFADNATTAGASNQSYVVGKVYKTGDDAFTFPVGKNGFYAPIMISAPVNTTDQYVAEYFMANPKNQFGAAISDSLVQVSDTEYWDLERVAGSSEVKVTLSYDPARSAYVANPQDLRIAHFRNNSTWVNEGLANVATTPTYSLYATRTAQKTFSPFTFGSVSGNNPLPVVLLNFSAKATSGQVNLYWETASEMNNDRYEIERSLDGRLFSKIGEVAGNGNSHSLKRYAFTDKNPPAKVAYYRLKQFDFDGKVTFSKVVSVNSKAEFDIKVYPNPAREYLNITLPQNSDLTEIQILNEVGKIVQKIRADQSQSEVKINISGLPAGFYFIKVSEEQVPVKFIKVN